MCWACDHGSASHLEQVGRLIDRHGWAVQYVETGRAQAPYAYSVGLTAVGLPELVVTGLRPARAATLLNQAASRLRAGVPPVPGSVLVLRGGMQVEVVRLAEPDAHLPVAAELFGCAVRAVQLVWADGSGRSPWHPVFRRGGGQPVLGPRELAG